MDKYQLPSAVAAARLRNIFVGLVQGDWFHYLDNSVTSLGSCKLASLLIEKTQQQNCNRIGVKTK